MASSITQRDRHAVPRLRSFADTIRRGELSSINPLRDSPFTKEMAQNAIDDFQNTPTISVAADLVSVALSLGQTEVAKDAAELILKSSDAPIGAQRLAAVCLGKRLPDDPVAIHQTVFGKDLYPLIHKTRLQLQRYPADAVLWTNLSAMYLALALPRQSKRAITAALSLAPQNRFVLRSASRILLHLGEGDYAQALLARADALRTDPWLLSAEIAVSAANDDESDHIKFGQRLIENGRINPVDGSELAAEIATIRGLDGNMAAAKKLTRWALQQPTENAVAQLVWLRERQPGIPELVNETLSYEANAYLTKQRGELRYSLQQTRHWQDDQPFSGRPASHGSYIASRLRMHQASIDFAKRGLVTNPDDMSLMNNLAFSLARTNRVEEATAAIRPIITGSPLPPRQWAAFQATTGLIAYRAGHLELGRKRYELAMEAARRYDLPTIEAVAMAYFAMEELRAETPEACSIKDRALELGRRRFTAKEDLVLITELEEFANLKEEQPLADPVQEDPKIVI